MKEILFTIIGSLIGSFLGLLPGFHVNNIIPFLLTLPFLPLDLSIFIVSIAVSQIVSSFLPSVFLGAPESENALAVLPGHKMLLEGRGREAVKLVLVGSLLGAIFTILLSLATSSYFKMLYKISRPFIHYLIILTIALMLLTEKSFRRIVRSIFVLLLSGLFGLLIFNFPLISQNIVLFPALSGLFGASTLLTSLSERTKIPKQKRKQEIMLKFDKVAFCSLLGSFAGILVGFLPAIGISQAAIMVQYLAGIREVRSFLVTLGSINVANEIFSLFCLYLVKNPRSGASVAIQKIMGKLVFEDVLLFMLVSITSLGISSIITLLLSKEFSKLVERINYKFLTLFALSFLTLMVFIFSGLGGLLIFLTATSIGFTTIKLKVKRSYCMGVLLIPSILFFSKLTPYVLKILRI